MTGWAAKAAIWLIGILLIGLTTGYVLGGFAVGRDTHRVYYGYQMPDAGSVERSAALSAGRDRLDAVAGARLDFD
ncbi:hypothetical protein LC593_35075 [Nostoc sp. CHAB 5844]|nr:hypothetical protein [Nostoc sp. CHAB 5844]